MPLYEYKCKSCDHQFEKLVSISKAKEPQECPKCKSLDSQKQMSTFSLAGPRVDIPAAPSGGGFS